MRDAWFHEDSRRGNLFPLIGMRWCTPSEQSCPPGIPYIILSSNGPRLKKAISGDRDRVRWSETMYDVRI